MPDPIELTFIVVKPIRVNGHLRGRGDVIPEAEFWPKLETYLDGGHLMLMPKHLVRKENWPDDRIGPQQAPLPSQEPAEGQVSAMGAVPGTEDVSDMTIQEIKTMVSAGELTREEVYEAESAKDNPRATLMRWLYEE